MLQVLLRGQYNVELPEGVPHALVSELPPSPARLRCRP